MSLQMIKQIFLSFFRVLEDLLGYDPRKPKNIFQNILIITVLLFSIIFCAIITGVFCIVHYSVNTYLKYKHKHDFIELLTPLDAVNERDDEKIVIHIILMQKATEKTSLENLLKCVEINMRKAEESCVKLTCTVKKCLGYYYYLQTNTKGDIIVTNCNTGKYLNEDDIKKFLNERIVGKEMLKDKMWMVTVLEQPITLNNVIQFGLIISVRHCIGDGTAIIGMMKNRIFENSNFIVIKSNLDAKNIEKDAFSTQRYLYKNPFIATGKDRFKDLQYDPKEYLSFFLEERPKYVQMVKDIKNKLNVQFGDVLIGGIVTAIKDYCKINHILLDDYINGSTVVRPFTKAYKNLFSGKFDFNQVSNQVELLCVGIPTNLTDNVEMILNINTIRKKAMSGAEIPTKQVFFKLLEYFPAKVMQSMTKTFSENLVFSITNLSGIRSGEVSGKTFQNVFFFASQFYNFGFCFYIFNVGDKFQIAVKSRKGIVRNVQELDFILERTMSYIDNVYKTLKLNV